MGLFDAVTHLINLFLPALGLGALAAALAKLLWRRELAGQSWLRLALPSALAATVAVLTSVLLFSRDGRMAMYGLMVLLCAITLWWRGFGPGRR